jgi:hypothetical protein
MGRIGKRRRWYVVALLTCVSVGLYGLYWLYRVFQELRDYSGQGTQGVIAVVLAVNAPMLPVILLPLEIGKLYERADEIKPVTWSTGLWVLLPILGLFLWLYRVQTAINDYWEMVTPSPA